MGVLILIDVLLTSQKLVIPSEAVRLLEFLFRNQITSNVNQVKKRKAQISLNVKQFQIW